MTRRERRDTDHEARANAKAAAAAEVRRHAAIGVALDLQAQLDEVRGGRLELPTMIAQGDLSRVSMVLWLQNVTVLSDLARTAPHLSVRLDAADRAAQRTHDMLALIAESSGQLGAKVVNAQSQPATVSDGEAAPPGVVITQEQAVEILKQRRLRLAGGA